MQENKYIYLVNLVHLQPCSQIELSVTHYHRPVHCATETSSQVHS